MHRIIFDVIIQILFLLGVLILLFDILTITVIAFACMGLIKVFKGLKKLGKNDEQFFHNSRIDKDFFNPKYKKLNKTARREMFLRDLILSSISSFETKDRLKTIVQKTGEYYKSDRCFFIEYDLIKKEYLPIQDYEVYKRKESIKDIEGCVFTPERLGMFHEKPFNDRQIIVISNIEKFNFPPLTRLLMDEYGVKSTMYAPVLYGDKFLGALIIDTVSHCFKPTKEDIEIFKSIANQSAIVLYQAKLYKQIKSFGEKENRQHRVLKQILNQDKLEQACNVIVQELSTMLNSDVGTLSFYDQNLNIFTNCCGSYFKNENYKNISNIEFLSKKADSFALQKLENDNVFVFNKNQKANYLKEFNDFLERTKINSGLVFPVFHRKKLIAVLFFADYSKDRTYSEHELYNLRYMMPLISACLKMYFSAAIILKTSTVEKKLRAMISKIRELKEHDDVYDYFMKNLCELFDADGGIHLHFDQNLKILIKNKFFKTNQEIPPEKKQKLCSLLTQKSMQSKSKNITIISDPEADVEESELKELLKELNISSLLATYPVMISSSSYGSEYSLNLIFSKTVKKWTSEDIALFRLTEETITAVYLELEKGLKLEETRRNFIATLTHDLKSPLLAEQKALEALMASKPGAPIGNFFLYFQELHNTGEDLLKLIENILSVFHYESGGIQLNIEANNFGGLILDAIKSLKPLAEDKECTITEEIDNSIPSVQFDRGEIKRVLINLISNSIKHTPNGTQVKIKSEKKENEVVISISDNGSGIPEDEKPMIFDKYHTKKRKVGTGLGLYLSKQIIEIHKGRIWFDSEVGKGTTFYFTLPLN